MRGWIPSKGFLFRKIVGHPDRTPRNRRSRTSSGPEGSSDKRCGLCRGSIPVNFLAYIFLKKIRQGVRNHFKNVMPLTLSLNLVRFAHNWSSSQVVEWFKDSYNSTTRLFNYSTKVVRIFRPARGGDRNSETYNYRLDNIPNSIIFLNNILMNS